MNKYPGLLTFLPVPDPGLPEPYATGSPEEKMQYEKSEEGKAQYWENMQKVNNHTAIFTGNKAAGRSIDEYNAQIRVFVDNGGASSGLKLPRQSELNLEACYPPAVDATATYHPPAGGKDGYWAPNPGAAKTETEVWSLPPGTILYEKQS